VAGPIEANSWNKPGSPILPRLLFKGASIPAAATRRRDAMYRKRRTVGPRGNDPFPHDRGRIALKADLADKASCHTPGIVGGGRHNLPDCGPSEACKVHRPARGRTAVQWVTAELRAAEVLLVLKARYRDEYERFRSWPKAMSTDPAGQGSCPGSRNSRPDVA
jgi:hypothetical protein